MIKIIESNRSEQKLRTQINLEKSWNQLMSREDLGFFKTPSRDFLWNTSQTRGTELREKFDELVILGIGGSSLGAKAIQNFLSDQISTNSLHIWDGLDPAFIEQSWKKLKNPKKTHFLIISKSGTTLETLSLAQWVSEKLSPLGLKIEDQSTAITELKDSSLSKWASDNSVPVLEVPLDVGGRFSVLTPVALVAAAFVGVEVNALRRGAQAALEDNSFVLGLAEETLKSFERNEWITLFWYYSEYFFELGRWTQQLWAESLAKRQNRANEDAPRVSTPIYATGPADQHSILQQVMEGARDKWVWIIETPDISTEPFRSDIFNSRYGLSGLRLNRIHQVQSESITRALDQSGVSVLRLRFDKRDPQSLGFYFMCLELLIGVLGEALDIDAFDQPGVELGKTIARDLLSK